MPEDPAAQTPDWLLLVIPLGFLIVFPLFWCSICLILAKVGGWQRLARRYGTDQKPEGTRLSSHSGKINFVGYNNCLTVHVSEQGIHVAIMILFRPGHQPLLIPWRDIHHMRQEKFLWMTLTSFEVGDPKTATLRLGKEVHELALGLVGAESAN